MKMLNFSNVLIYECLAQFSTTCFMSSLICSRWIWILFILCCNEWIVIWRLQRRPYICVRARVCVWLGKQPMMDKQPSDRGRWMKDTNNNDSLSSTWYTDETLHVLLNFVMFQCYPSSGFHFIFNYSLRPILTAFDFFTRILRC